MAHVYVRSGAGGAGTGADWANAYTTLAAALTAKAAGDNFWVSEDHAETQASAMTLTSPGTSAAPCTVICVNHAGTVPPVSADLRTTATVTTTGANAITITGHSYMYGITFSSGDATNNCGVALGTGGVDYFYLKACALKKIGTGTGTTAIRLGQNAQGVVVLDNTTVTLANVADAINCGGSVVRWINTASALLGTIPTSGVLFAGIGSSLLMEGVDLSAIASTKSVFTTAQHARSAVVKNCKIASGAVLASSGMVTSRAGILDFINVDSGATNYRNERCSYAGMQTIETTIVRTGGATDGTTPISWKIVTTANSKWIAPFESIPLAIWNDTTGANVTVTVYGVWGGGAVPKNDDIWIEASYMGSGSSPIATINTSNTKADYLATNADQGTDSSTWGGSTTKFKMSVTLSSPKPEMRGFIYVTIKAAKASSTFYIDPKIVLS